jgi:adenylyl cyclase-associated protein
VAAPVPPQIEDFDALIKGDVQNFVNLGEKIGGLVAEQVNLPGILSAASSY